MKKAVLLVLTALVAVVCRAGWESWLKTGLYHASFEDYEYGWSLSNLGAINGLWSIPSDVMTRAASVQGPGQYIEYSTLKSGMIFTPNSTGNRDMKSVVSEMLLTAYEDGSIPDLSQANARGAFSINVTMDEMTNFVGWTADGWQNLHDDSLEEPLQPIPGLWYDVSMKFLKTGETVRVQYRLKRMGEENFTTLCNVDGETWLPAGQGRSDEIVSDLEFQGEGALRYLTGSEPRRGLLIGLVPWREMLIDESVYHQGSGDWYVFDYDTEKWRTTPVTVAGGDAYGINVPEGENYTGFRPKTESSSGRQTIEFTVRFVAPNDNDAMPTNDVCALVRLVEMPLTDVKNENIDYQFACLANGSWHTNDNPRIQADVNTDYTVEIALDMDIEGTGKGQAVSYRIKAGRGGESGAYQDLLLNVPVSIGDPLFAFFGGIGRVYSIKSSAPAQEENGLSGD